LWAVFSAAGRTPSRRAPSAPCKFQTSQAGGVILLIYGSTKASPNLLDYDDFHATASKQAGGKG
jgi:hypothetical protein